MHVPAPLSHLAPRFRSADPRSRATGPGPSAAVTTVSALTPSRNDACPCGSGLKYKRCCLAREQRITREARLDDVVGRRIQDWSSEAVGDEITAALEEFVGPDRTMDEDELQIFATWFHNDRELEGGGTPAERYAALPDLLPDERAAAGRIAAARLGVHRVLAVEPGSWIELEDIAAGSRARVRSPKVSRDAVRWDLLVVHVMDGDPPSLWGSTRLLEPSDQPELFAAMGRAAEKSAARAGQGGMAALELMRFTPSRPDPSFFTLEGDPVAHGQAAFHVRDLSVARERLRKLGGLHPGEPLEIELTVPRDALVRDRPPLPPGAIVVEAGPLAAADEVPIATVRLEGRELHIDAMSEERLDEAVDVIAGDFGDLAKLREREIVPIEQRLDEYESEAQPPSPPPPGLTPSTERCLVGDFMTERTRRWLDDPHPLLDGQTPREAAGGERRAEVVRLVRGIENSTERARRRGQPAAEIAWLRGELGVDGDLAA